MTDVPETAPERPIIWSPGRSATVYRGRPYLELLYICFSSSRCLKQEILLLKNTFFIKLSIILLVP